MSETLTPDICVIGAGSGGLSVAAAAAAFGVDVVLIEKGKMGGDCLNYGCVPSKALLAAGKKAVATQSAEPFGVHAGAPKVRFAQVNDHVKGVIDAIAPNDSVERFTGLGVKVIQTEGRFRDKETVVAGDQLIRARRFVIATGSVPFIPPIPGLDRVNYLTNETIFEVRRKPRHLLIIGAGPIGLEMAQAHARLGVKIDVVDMGPPLAKDDREAVTIVTDQLRRDGVHIHSGVKITGVSGRVGAIKLEIEANGDTQTLEGSHLLVAAGRRANLGGLGLDAAAIRFDRNGITVNKKLKTSNRRVYAIGDVIGGLQFTHAANYHAGLVIRHCLFRLPVSENRDLIPWVTYTDPELSHIGPSEELLRTRHRNIRILRWPYAENDRAQAERHTDGFIKLITTGNGRILSATIVGAHAGELIQFWVLAISKRLKVSDVAGFVLPYPTYSEISKRAALSYYADQLNNKWLRRTIKLMRMFG